LLGYGLLGLICYLAVFKSLFSTFTKGRGLPKWLTVVMWMIWFFNAFMNMFYTYACATAAYPFMLLGVALFWEEKNKKEMLRRQQTAQKEGLIRAKSEVDWN
jgi:predicted membrane protein